MVPLNTFDRHLLREWLQILFLFLVALCGIIVAQICFDDLRNMMEDGAKVVDVLRYIGVTLPSFFPFILPLSLLISLLFTLNQLHRANELTAMRAAGVGFLRLMAPVWLFGGLTCVLFWWLNSAIVPWSVEQSREMEERLEFRKEAQLVTGDRVGAKVNIAFDEPLAKRMWFFNRFSQANQHGYGVMVSEMDADRHVVSQILATEAWRGPSGRWEFHDGRQLQFADQGTPFSNTPFTLKVMPDYREDPNLMLLTDRRARDLSLFELRRVMDYFAVQNPTREVPFAVRYYSILADTLGPLIVIAIAIPFAVTGVRVNPAVGVGKAIGLYILYYVLTVVAQSLAAGGTVTPELAAWLPNLGMIALAAWFFIRLR
jgi:lipopolysaccharide export system permease protein